MRVTGPKGLPLVGCLPELLKNRGKTGDDLFWHKYYLQCGPIYQVPMKGFSKEYTTHYGIVLHTYTQQAPQLSPVCRCNHMYSVCLYCEQFCVTRLRHSGFCLDQHGNLHMRLSLEACHIRKQPLPLNRDKGSLPPTYDHLLKNS